MSKKYVPSFIKDNATNAVPVTKESVAISSAVPVTQSRFAGGGVVSQNKFAALSDDFPSINSNKSATITSTTLAGATLASITSSSAQQAVGKKSYASKFSEQTKNGGYPSKPVKIEPKVDVSSESDFPSLGASSSIRKNASNSSLASSTSATSAASAAASDLLTQPTAKFADFAKSWAQKVKEEEEAAAAELERKRILKEEYDSLRSMIKIPGFKHKKAEHYVSPDDIEDEDEYNNETNDYLGGDNNDDDYHVPSGEEDESEQEYDEDEQNMDDQPVNDSWR